MRVHYRIGLAVLALVLTPVTAVAESAAIEEFFARLDSTEAAPEAVVRVSKGSDQLLAVCTANCADGSTVTISAASCSAVDAACPTQAGYVQDLGTGAITSCPACPCVATTACKSGPAVSCKSFSESCFVVSKCYVLCDGVATWCPPPYGRICPV